MGDQVLEGKAVTAKRFLGVEDLEVYKKLCRLHIEVCDLTHSWPHEEKYELEQKIPERDRRWQVKEESFDYGSNGDTHSQGWPGDLY
jgi:hypothetical protein